MKKILEFNVPEDNEEFEMANNGYKYQLALYEIDQFLRGKIKYQDLSEAQEQIYQEVRDKLHELTNEYGVSVS